MNYVLVRSPSSGNLYVFLTTVGYEHKYPMWEVLAEGPDEKLLLTMLALTKEPK